MHRIQYTTVLGTSRRTDIHMETLQLPVNGSSPVKRGERARRLPDVQVVRAGGIDPLSLRCARVSLAYVAS